jgi:hypothetical protein
MSRVDGPWEDLMAELDNAKARLLLGGCFCGAVRYTVADEFAYALNCHCSNCRRTTGSAFKPFAGIARHKLSVGHGDDNLMVYGEETAHDAHCRRCGSLLYSVVRDGAYAHVTLGTLADDPSIRPPRTSSSAPRRHGSRSPTACRSIKSMS